MVEVGVAPPPQQYRYDSDPRDVIELNHDIYKPSVRWSNLSEAIEKDMVLANLSTIAQHCCPPGTPDRCSDTHCEACLRAWLEGVAR